MLGALAGHWLRSVALGPVVRLLGLAVAGMPACGAGHRVGRWFPVIKNLWTSSFVLVAGGWSLLLLAAFHGVIDVLGCRRWAFFFASSGPTPSRIYVLPEFIDFPRIADFFLGGVVRHSGSFAPVAKAAGVVAVEWVLLLILYRNRVFLRV